MPAGKGSGKLSTNMETHSKCCCVTGGESSRSAMPAHKLEATIPHLLLQHTAPSPALLKDFSQQ